jgi:hypothetical protein
MQIYYTVCRILSFQYDNTVITVIVKMYESYVTTIILLCEN